MAKNCENGTDPVSVVETEPRTRTIDRTEVFLIPAPEQHESAYLLPKNAVDWGVVFGI